ncbi:MAG: glycosidase [Bacteroidetes bacterium]|nr:MAG: glycosidase [Bacteroidota bacterium]PTM08672.1 MAG: glycosidase [Bacteroidota bacterium]
MVPPTSKYPILYEINTRIWRQRFGAATRLLDIPDTYWQQLAALGVDYVWLMGVWQTGPNILHYALDAGLQQAYQQALPDWQEADIVGSPYAIDHYVLHPDLGAAGDLVRLKKRLHAVGLRLMLDFVPNHFHAETSLLRTHPEIFLEVTPDYLQRDPQTYYQPPGLNGRVFAHGKDPYFAAWQDTVQVNYAAPAAREFMGDLLLQLAEQCDGLRCDMAMLALPNVLAQTWGNALTTPHGERADFWPAAIQRIRERYPNFVFLAEVYWNLEWMLQEQGFDYTYDKRLLDRIHQGNTQAIREHLWAGTDFQRRSARFLENHDEDRIRSVLPTDQAQAAALITYTIPGLRFFFQGQWEGRRVRVPVQLGREPLEQEATNDRLFLGAIPLAQLPAFAPVSLSTAAFYDYLLQLLREPTLQQGHWEMLELGNTAILSWEWRWKDRRFLIVINHGTGVAEVALPSLSAGAWQHYQGELVSAGPQRLMGFRWLVLHTTG